MTEPSPEQYLWPHVYTRGVHGNCVCGMEFGHWLHIPAAHPDKEHRATCEDCCGDCCDWGSDG